MAQYGIPYQGSKGAFAPMIHRAIEQRLPAGAQTVLVDPFCGGYAVSHRFAEHGWAPIASDLDRYTIALLARVLTKGLPEKAIVEWVSREHFIACRDRPDSVGRPDWWIGFVRCVWSFGNGGTSYIYGAHLEESKRLIHELVTEHQVSARLAEITGVSLRAQARVAAIGDRRGRRLAWGRLAERARTRRADREMQSMRAAERLSGVRLVLQSMQRVEQINSLQGPDRVPRVLDYRDALAAAPPGAVIYLDPPYRGVSGYQASKGFDSDEMWAHATALARSGAQVYVSEYTAPGEWASILSFSRQNRMAADAGAKSASRAREHLFTYRA